MRIKCMHCGKPVSTEVPDKTVIRAYVECPECINAVSYEKPCPGAHLWAIDEDAPSTDCCQKCGSVRTR